MLNQDYKDMLRALAEENVRFLLVGAYAMAVHGYLRTTTDIDIWVMPSSDNADAVLRAAKRFGAPLHEVTKSDFERDDTVFQIGVAPRRIDILTGLSGLEFEAAFQRSVETDLDGVPVRVLSVDDLIQNKRAAGRMRDLADAEAMEALRDAGPLSSSDAE